MIQKRLAQLNFPTDLPFNGEIHRFDRGGSLNGWFTGAVLPSGIQIAHFGDWKTGESHSWHSKEGEESSLSPNELDTLQKEMEAHRQMMEKARVESQEKAAKEVNDYIRKCASTKDHPYLKKKHIAAELFFDPDNGALVIPLVSSGDRIVNCQRIFTDGSKRFWSGGQVKGASFRFKGAPGKAVFICEGWATGYSIHKATNRDVYVAFNTTNLLSVAQQVQEVHQDKMIIFAADNDAWTKNQKGDPWNPGIKYAEEAAFEVGGYVTYPKFKDISTKPTDFNDLHVLEGIATVTDQLGDYKKSERQQEIEREPAQEETGLTEVSIGPLTSKSKKGPTEKEIVNHLLDKYGDNLRQQDGDLFHYEETHWSHLGYPETNKIKRQIQSSAGGGLGYRQIENAFKQLLVYVPSFPPGVNIFSPRPYCANFLNGTLTVHRSADHTFTKTFTPHDKKDYLTHVIPHEYHPDRGAENGAFLEMLDRIFQGDEDKEGKIRAVRQMFGACLMPLFPRFFLLHGPSGGGKSTLLIAASRLVSAENMCSVEPHEFRGFNMDSMAGKLVNLVTDIDMHKPFHDANIKKVIDRMPIKIDRKFKQSLFAPLPAAHIFGANAIPPTLEGTSRAHNRRWTFIKLNELVVPKEDRKLDFGNWVFDQGPQGVLNFALQGLDDLLENQGQYFVPDSGAKDMQEWETDNDTIAQFIRDIKEGTLELPIKDTVVVDPGGSMRRSRLWEVYKAWWEENFPRKLLEPGRNTFYSSVQGAGFASRKTEGSWVVEGLSPKTGDETHF